MSDLMDDLNELRAEFRRAAAYARSEQEAAQVLQQIWLDELDHLTAWVRTNAPELEPSLRARLVSVAARVKAVRGISTDGARH